MKTKRDIQDLREHLFDVIEGVKDGKTDVTRASTIAKLGQTIINSAMAEVNFIKAAKLQKGSGFLLVDQPQQDDEGEQGS